MKDFIYLSALTSFVVFSWIVFSIVHNLSNSTIPPNTSILITPIPASFDRKTLDEIKKRKNLSVNLEESLVASTTPIPTSTPIPTPTQVPPENTPEENLSTESGSFNSEEVFEE